MKKIIPILLSIFIVLNTFISAFAVDETIAAEETAKQESPILISILFNNASIDGEFNPDIKKYKITVDNKKVVSISSYVSSDIYAEVLLTDIVDGENRVCGHKLKLKNDGGSNEYIFEYSNLKKASTSKNARLKDIKFNYGELSPKFQPNKYKYTLYIPSDLSILTINASTENKDASVSGPIEIVLGQGDAAPLSITVTSGDTTVEATYKLIIKRLDMTVKEYEKEISSPNFKSVIKKSFYKQPLFIVLSLAAVIVTSIITSAVVLHLKKKHKAEFEETENKD